MKEERSRLLIGILVFIIIILVGIVLYTFAIRPAISGYIVRTQTQGYQYAIFQIMQQAAQCQPVPLIFGNQTINVIAVECLQQSQT